MWRGAGSFRPASNTWDGAGAAAPRRSVLSRSGLGGSPVHSGWATTHGARVPELERDVVLRWDEAYLYDAFTPPMRRGHGAFGFVLDHLFAALQERGARAVYSLRTQRRSQGPARGLRATASGRTLAYIRLYGRAPLVYGRSRSAMPTLVRGAVENAQLARMKHSRISAFDHERLGRLAPGRGDPAVGAKGFGQVGRSTISTSGGAPRYRMSACASSATSSS